MELGLAGYGAVLAIADVLQATRLQARLERARRPIPKLTAEQIAELRQRRQQGDLVRVLMRDYNVSKATVYRYLSGDLPFENR